MKKLLIALVAVAMAAVSQAALVDWKVTYEGNIDGATAYVFNSKDKTAVTAILNAFTTADALMNYALKFEGIPSSITGTAEDKRGEWTTDFSPAIAAEGVTAADSIFAVIFQGDIKVGTDYLMSSDMALAGYTYEQGSSGPGVLNLKNDNLPFSGTIMGTGPVPEPTSGLLLLLGVAGLALRRKQK